MRKYFSFKNLTICIAVIFVIVSFFINSELCTQSVLNNLSLWFFNVLPVLFPFFVCTKIISDLNMLKPVSKFFNRPMKFLFNLPGSVSYIFLISIISGYPTGAKLIQEYHKKGILGYNQCVTCCALCSSSSPLFVFGTVAALLHSLKAAAVIYFAHIISCFINGLIFRCKTYSKDTYETIGNENFNLSDTVYTSTVSILTIGGLIAVFGLLTDLLLYYNIFNYLNLLFFPINKLLNCNIGIPLLGGFLEITKGIALINLPIYYAIPIASMLLSFSGICILVQQYTYLKDCGISFGKFFIIKLIQSFISLAAAALITTFIL